MSSKLKTLTKIVILFIIIIVIILLYSYFIGNNGLKVKEYKIVNKKIPNDFYGLKIVHISDIHYGKNYNEKKLEKVVSKINEINPDLVFLTGDLVDNGNVSKEDEDEIKKILSKIKANLGKYAITGNHDYKYENWAYVIKDAGFINLNDTYQVLYSGDSKILISGISTNYYGNIPINEKLKDTSDFLQKEDVNYKILLIHEPDYIEQIDEDFDLILAGHSHNGQITLPFIGALYTPKGSKKYYKNYYKIKTSDLYISSGLGTSILPFRLFNKPSFNFYRLVNN